MTNSYYSRPEFLFSLTHWSNGILCRREMTLKERANERTGEWKKEDKGIKMKVDKSDSNKKMSEWLRHSNDAIDATREIKNASPPKMLKRAELFSGLIFNSFNQQKIKKNTRNGKSGSRKSTWIIQIKVLIFFYIWEKSVWKIWKMPLNKGENIFGSIFGIL